MWLFVILVMLGVIALYYIVRWKHDATRVPDIHNKYVLITGCDTGFGYEAAKKFDTLGCNVIAGCLTTEGEVRLKQECSSRLLAVSLDVCSDTSVESMLRRIQQHIPHDTGLWGLVNNAGAMGPVGPLEWHSAQEMLNLLNLNVCGAMRVTNAVLPLLKREAHGARIVITASVLGHLSLPYLASYCISKHAVVAYCHALRRELKCFGVSVHTIEPGGHRTPFLSANAIKQKGIDAYNNLPEEIQRQYGDKYLKKMLWAGTDVARGIATESPTGVVKAYENALFSEYPRLYYVVGWDSLIYLGLAYLPVPISDWLFSLSIMQPKPALRR